MQGLTIKVNDKDYSDYMAIENTVKYLYRNKIRGKKPYKTYAYLSEYQGFDLSADDIVRSFEKQQMVGENQLFHVILSFEDDFYNSYGEHALYINEIARKVGEHYQCCFAFHRKNPNTYDYHGHFHMIIMTQSYNGFPPLDRETLRNTYLEYAKAIAPYYGFEVKRIEMGT